MFSFLSRSTPSIALAGWILSVSAFVSMFLGLVRTRLLLHEYGVGIETDIYNAAFRVPDLIYLLVMSGALSAAFIPVFISYIQKNKKEAWHVAQSFFIASVVVIIVFALIMALIMPFVIDILASGFSDNDKQTIVELSRIMLISPLLLGMSAVLSGVLQSMNKFIVYALAPLFYNAGLILGIVVFTKWWGIHGLAWGVALGALLHLLIQVPAIIRSGFVVSRIRAIHSAVWRIWKLMIPRSFALGLYHVNISIITALASRTSEGSITVFMNSYYVSTLLVGIIGVSFGTALFPALSGAYLKHEYKKYVTSLSRIVRGVFFLAFPISVLFFVLRFPIVQLIYGVDTVRFDDVRLMAAVLGVLSLGASAYVVLPVISRAFYARGNTITPVLVSIVGVVATVGLSTILLFVFPNTSFLVWLEDAFVISDVEARNVIALPLAVSFAGIVSLIAAFVLFVREDVRNRGLVREIGGALARISGAGLFAGLVAWGALQLISPGGAYTTSSVRLIFESSIVVSVMILMYSAIAVVMKFPEREMVSSFLKRGKR